MYIGRDQAALVVEHGELAKRDGTRGRTNGHVGPA